MLEKCKVDAYKLTLIGHGFPKDGRDHDNLTDILDFLRCQWKSNKRNQVFIASKLS